MASFLSSLALRSRTDGVTIPEGEGYVEGLSSSFHLLVTMSPFIVDGSNLPS